MARWSPAALPFLRRVPSVGHSVALQDLLGHVLAAFIGAWVGGDADLLHSPETAAFRDIVAAAVALAAFQASAGNGRLNRNPFRDLVTGYKDIAHV